MPGMIARAPDRLPILIAPSPLLKARARPVAREDDAAVRDLLPRMFATMDEAPASASRRRRSVSGCGWP